MLRIARRNRELGTTAADLLYLVTDLLAALASEDAQTIAADVAGIEQAVIEIKSHQNEYGAPPQS